MMLQAKHRSKHAIKIVETHNLPKQKLVLANVYVASF